MGAAAHQENGTREISILGILGSEKTDWQYIETVLYPYLTWWVYICTIPIPNMVGIYIGHLDTYKYIGNPDGNLSCIFLAKRIREMGPGFKGCRRGTGAGKKGCFAHVFTFDKLNT